MEGSVTITVSPRRVAQALTLIVLSLTLASALVQSFTYLLDHGQLYGLVNSFDVSREGNVPTWYSSFALLICSMLLAIIAFAKRASNDRYVIHWTTLSILFLYLSVDEGAQIHELAVEPIRDVVATGGFLYEAWVIPGALAVVAIALAYRRFVSELPSATRRLVVAGALLFAGGALGGELLQGYLVETDGRDNFGVAFSSTVEEFFEMLAVVVFIYALMSYMSTYVQEARLRIGSQR